MKILFLGGTQFVGRHMVEAALAKGYEVTLFNRGRTNAHLFPEAEKIKGDRDGGLEPLAGKTWDAVVDVNGYVPRLVRDSANFLKGSVGQYIFVSTGSVYDFTKLPPKADESAELMVLEDETTEEWNGPAYGGLKVLCERAVEEIYPDNFVNLRLGVVSGPYDPTDRVTYYVTRTALGGEMLVPGGPDYSFQTIDARDLANFTMLCIEKKLCGTYNTIGQVVRWDEFLADCQKAAGVEVTNTWVDDVQFAMEHIDMGARPYGVIPMAMPPEMKHLFSMNCSKAEKVGLTFRSYYETAKAVLAWDKTRPEDEERVAGLTLEQEKDLLEKWRARG